MIGHSVLRMPKALHSAKPTTVNAYMRAEIAAVSPVLITFQTCGTKLVTEQIEAPYPTSNVVSNFRRPLFPVKEMSVRHLTLAIWHRGLPPAPDCLHTATAALSAWRVRRSHLQKADFPVVAGIAPTRYGRAYPSLFRQR